MCIALPLMVRKVDGLIAACEARGVVRTVNLFLIHDETLATGDWVLVHLDSAVRKLDAAEAEAAWATHDEIMSALAPAPLAGASTQARNG
jgi:hydrogenase expression/formation protein HypC